MLSSFLAFTLTIGQLVTVQVMLAYTRQYNYLSVDCVRQTPSRTTTRQPTQESVPQKEEVLTNDSIIKLLKAGIDEDLIITKTQNSKHSLDTSTNGIIALKQAGASSRLIQFMMDPSKPVAHRPVPEPSSDESNVVARKQLDSSVPSNVDSALGADPRMEEIGVYLIDAGKPIQLEATGFSTQKVSVFDTVKAMGFKAKQRAVLKGAGAPVRSKITRALFLLHVPEGGSPGDFVVVRLEKKSKTREAVVGTATLLGVSSGFEDKRVMKFSSTKLATRKYLIRFEVELEPGEYAFYPVNGLQGYGANLTAGGKLYDFGIDQ
jgi:hypothetical protein